MKKIRALRQFSHYHAGNFAQGESRKVSDSAAEALVGMGLAAYVDAPHAADQQQDQQQDEAPATEAKAGKKK